jgi:rhodanese-related sulfurtransferase
LRAVWLDDLVREALETVEEVQPEEVARLLETPGREGWHVIDVREADEFEAGHLPGARHLPRGFLEVRADLVHTKRDPWLADRERKLVLYCGGGNRSALAAQSLLRMGFTCVRSMVEGFAGWTKRGYTIVGPPAS